MSDLNERDTHCETCGADLEEECQDCEGEGLNALRYDHCSKCGGSGTTIRECLACVYEHWNEAKL